MCHGFTLDNNATFLNKIKYKQGLCEISSWRTGLNRCERINVPLVSGERLLPSCEGVNFKLGRK